MHISWKSSLYAWKRRSTAMATCSQTFRISIDALQSICNKKIRYGSWTSFSDR